MAEKKEAAPKGPQAGAPRKFEDSDSAEEFVQEMLAKGELWAVSDIKVERTPNGYPKRGGKRVLTVSKLPPKEG